MAVSLNLPIEVGLEEFPEAVPVRLDYHRAVDRAVSNSSALNTSSLYQGE